ncbi:hypothetical protein GLAREA_08799 [Glarea lozoyensis ATCC 20868]|uniref:Uncharacterized protein n=1 Tax=Glarea lozoyensis (strain ATCC 20868 / MF5171) TaxID=1116229 RepID=S3DXG8_GLAL2|nr:uncharacterized protein GLAREA_08799 [Glarea lozoyensis ATCC 20868]EPE36636.1 hypothetical protein GLAREA_08799 [Glarea lozoyensis ATCC 20868]
MDTKPLVRRDFNSLPLETLQQIAEYLDKSYRPSLYAFGLASRTCHDATIPSIFRHVHLSISSPEALKRDIDALVKTLSLVDSSRHVQSLSIKGTLSFNSPSQRNVEGYKSSSSGRDSSFMSTGMNEILVGEEPCGSAIHIVYDESVIEKDSEEDIAWKPLASAIKTMPCLAKLEYNCSNQFPPSLLEALHDYNSYPQCKLYHNTFRLRTLLWDTPCPYELALAQSPCLYSVKVECCHRDSQGNIDFNQEAIMELVTGLAPNLKEVVVVNLRPESSWKYHHRPWESWQGLPGFVPGQSVGSLTLLSLLGEIKRNPRGPCGFLQTWAKQTDFSCLQRLTLGGGFGCESVGINDEMMKWVAENCLFPRLKSLRVRLDRDGNNRPNYSENAIAFFESFQCLDELSVSGPIDPRILESILFQHGQTLTKLSIRPIEDESKAPNGRLRGHIPMTCTTEQIIQIHIQCPLLQELALPVKRTQSDAIEAEKYKTFRKMERLSSLFLILDCSEWRVTRDPASLDESTFNEFDQETFEDWVFLKNGHIRQTLLNCAVDETLARSIWETICRNKIGCKLQNLKIWTTGCCRWGDNTYIHYIKNVVDNLSRSWLFERIARDEGDIINVKELGRRIREAHDQYETSRWHRRIDAMLVENNVVVELIDEQESPKEVFQVFRSIWPDRKGKDWREDWSSLPLQV